MIFISVYCLPLSPFDAKALFPSFSFSVFLIASGVLEVQEFRLEFIVPTRFDLGDFVGLLYFLLKY